MARLPLLALLLPLAVLGCKQKCKCPVPTNLNVQVEAGVKAFVESRGSGSGDIVRDPKTSFVDRNEATGCAQVNIRCFDGANTNDPPTSPPGVPFNVIIPPNVPLPPLRVRRQFDDVAPDTSSGYARLNYYGYTADGKNVSLHSYWDKYESFDYLTLDCQPGGGWAYNDPSGSSVEVTGVYCFWLTETGTDDFLGEHVPNPEDLGLTGDGK